MGNLILVYKRPFPFPERTKSITFNNHNDNAVSNIYVGNQKLLLV